MNKKQSQLGMNPSTASARLIKDILFSYVKDEKCFHCGGSLTRETFSIEHKEPWLDSDKPLELFFSLENIGYSHIACNVGAARKVKSPCGTLRKYNNGCRCVPCTQASASQQRSVYTPEKRRLKYQRAKNRSIG